MSVHYAHADPPRTPWLPWPSLTDVLGVAALVIGYATANRKART